MLFLYLGGGPRNALAETVMGRKFAQLSWATNTSSLPRNLHVQKRKLKDGVIFKCGQSLQSMELFVSLLHRHTSCRSVRILSGLGSLLSYFEFMQSQPEIYLSPPSLDWEQGHASLPAIKTVPSATIGYMDRNSRVPCSLLCFLPSVCSFQI